MREANDRRKEIEKEHTETVSLLQEQQTEIQRKVATATDKSKAYESIETLQSKIRELEKKAELQNVLHEELVLEMAAIKRSSKGAATQHQRSTTPQTGSWPNCHLSPESNISTQDVNCVDQTGLSSCNSIENHVEQRSASKRPQYSGVASTATAPSAELHMHNQQVACITSEIDCIMEKIDQDNRILAELDKSRFTIANVAGATPSLGLSDHQLGRAMASTGVTVEPTYMVHHPQPISILPQVQQPTIPLSIAQQTLVNAIGGQYHPFVVNSGGPPALRGQQQMLVAQPQHTQSRIMPQLPTMVPTQFEIERLYSNLPDQQMAGQDSKLVDMLDIPGKGRCYVYIARYSYDPFQQSPNECPEAELAVNAGDYILVWGNMDEDGFFDAELLDGRRGLVPSNFVQKLVGDDLLDFHQSVVQGLRDCDDSASTNIPQDLDYPHSHSHQGDVSSKKLLCEYDLGDILEEDEEEEEADHLGEGPEVFFSVLVGPPKQLTLERQLNKSVLIGWNPPDAGSSPPIDCYHVYVDRVLKVTVKATERTRALVEGVDSNRPHRISVRSVTANRRTSRDAACTMVIGKDVPLGPTNVKASRVTATSAVISWLPSNSNYQHTVCVNNVELRTVKPGVYRHTITGLAPNTVYRVTVRAKNIRAPHFDEKSNIPVERYSCHIDFRTLPKGLPEPPVDIQVEAGPQDGTLLVTWQPPSSASPHTAGSLVTGYAVYADGKKVTDVDSPTGKHALIDINKLLGLNPKQVTVRTKSKDNQSSDSLPTPIPMHMLKGKQHNGKMEDDRRGINLRYSSSLPAHMRHQHRPGQVIETEENLSDKEIYPNNHMSIPSIEITKDTASEGNYSEEDYERMNRSCGRGAYEQRTAPRARQYHHPVHHQRHHRPHERDQFYSERSEGRGRAERDREREREKERERERERMGMMMSGVGYGRGAASGSTRPPVGPHPHMQSTAPAMRDKRHRWFVALFDYDPTTMSPNPDACEEELPFTEGDIIKVFGDKDADGFYWGECRGRRGFVPHNMVVEVQGMEGSAAGMKDRARDRDRWGDIYANMPVKKMIAMYDYDPQELSPNVDAEQVELSFNTGNVIYVYGEMGDDGFYMGELDGVRGLVPSNFLTEAPPEYGGKGGGRQVGAAVGAPAVGTHRQDRGHGPGARGPPPPPRNEPRADRRKDASPVSPQVDLRQVGRAGGMEKNEGVGGVLAGTTGLVSGAARSLGLARKYTAPPNPQLPVSTPSVQQAAQQPLQQSQHVDNKSTTQPSQQQQPTNNAPNLMQKLTEMTGGDTSVDHILSKGKELIFMKFGLGK
ncbi:RIMS-binding protein 2-like isoform X2 [Rhodnius prolixus]|uniref:RIMS-binding protein 2-like isoform X2 n=1 Tax=Rhodnius prolixus TaxID=13249 RepID=UPI003D18B6C6